MPADGLARAWVPGLALINVADSDPRRSLARAVPTRTRDARSLDCLSPKSAFHVPTIIAGVTVLEMAQGDGVLTTAQIEKAMIVGVKIKEALARSHKAGVTLCRGQPATLLLPAALLAVGLRNPVADRLRCRLELTGKLRRITSSANQIDPQATKLR